MKSMLVFVIGAVIAVIPVASFALDPRADLYGTTVTFKLKCKSGPCEVKGATLEFINNGGGDDAPKSVLEFYLSNDTTLTTETDTLLKRLSVGKLQDGQTGARKLSGGTLKKAGAVSGQYILCFLDAAETITESGENNVFVSAPLP